MDIDLNRNYNDLPWDVYLFQNDYIPKILSTYFKLKKFLVQDNFLAFGYNYIFHYEFHCPSFTFEAYPNPDVNKLIEKEHPLIYFFRYLNYPDIDDTYDSSTVFKTTGSTLGLIENVIKIIDKKLLPIIQEGGNELNKLLDDSGKKFESLIGKSRPYNIYIKNEEEKNAKKNFSPKYLNPTQSTARDIKKQLEQLLSE